MSFLAFLGTFGIAHGVTELVVKQTVSRRVLEKLVHADRIEVAQKIPSTLHGLLAGGTALYLLLLRQDFRQDVFEPYPALCDTLFSTTLGYSLYDMAVMYFQGGQHFSMWMHHFVESTGCFLIMQFREAPYFPACFSVTTISTVPLNLLWLLDKLQIKMVCFFFLLLVHLLNSSSPARPFHTSLASRSS